jgi:molybdopterin-guanine dinucleotide biosynthesis protein A
VRRLGAILAGGQSRRFGSDKAVAIVGGRTLIDRVAAALAPQVDAIVVVGRELADRPAPGLGPLGGLCAALDHARAHGFDAVLTAGCDVLPVPADLAVRLAPGPAVIDGQPLFGLWPATLAARLDAHLAAGGDRSLRRWVAATGARRVALAAALFNLNTPADLALYCETEGPGR